MIVRWSGEAQVNVSEMSNLNLSLTLVDVKLVYYVKELQSLFIYVAMKELFFSLTTLCLYSGSGSI